MEGYARGRHVSLGVGEGFCCVWGRLSTVYEGFLGLCFSGKWRKSRHKHSSNQKKLIIESACARKYYKHVCSLYYITGEVTKFDSAIETSTYRYPTRGGPKCASH